MSASEGEVLQRSCWCGGTESHFLYEMTSETGDRFSAYRCASCGVALLHPQPSPARLAAAYSASYYGATGRKFSGPIGAMVRWAQGGRARWVRRRLTGGARVLDVGCGNGGFVRQLRELGLQAEGTEWSEQSAGRARRESGVPVHAGDLLDLNLTPGSYDAVVLWHVFEHLPRPAETLAKVRELLAPGGLLFMAMPNMESWQANIFGPQWFHWDPPRHLHNFGQASLARLLEVQGFAMVTASTWSLEQNPYGFIQSCLNELGFPRERAYSVLKGIRPASRMTRLLDLAMLATLAPLGVLAALAETAAGQGGTITLVARRGK
jgi:SAM-dependent methyltransferase